MIFRERTNENEMYCIAAVFSRGLEGNGMAYGRRRKGSLVIEEHVHTCTLCIFDVVYASIPNTIYTTPISFSSLVRTHTQVYSAFADSVGSNVYAVSLNVSDLVEKLDIKRKARTLTLRAGEASSFWRWMLPRIHLKRSIE